VNLEVDVIAKYVERFVSAFDQRSSTSPNDSNRRERH
jgi:riboflavin synthase alpha subunit